MDQTGLAPGGNGPIARDRRRPFGITVAAVILTLLWLSPVLLRVVYFLRCTVVIDTFPQSCESAMWTLARHYDNVGYAGAVFGLAFGAIGVVAGVRLLGLRSRGLALGLAGVGMWIWVLGPDTLPKDSHRGFGSYAIGALGVAGCVYVILALLKWRDRFDRGEPLAAFLGTSTVRASPVPNDQGLGRFRFVVGVVTGAGLSLAGPLLVLSGLVVFIDWIAGMVEGIASAAALCPPGHYCTAASARAAVLGLLAASVGALASWAGLRLLRATLASRAVSSIEKRAQPAS